MLEILVVAQILGKGLTRFVDEFDTVIAEMKTLEAVGVYHVPYSDAGIAHLKKLPNLKILQIAIPEFDKKAPKML